MGTNGQCITPTCDLGMQLGLTRLTGRTLVQVELLFLYAGCISESLVFHRALHDMDFCGNLGDWPFSISKTNHLGCNESQVITTMEEILFAFIPSSSLFSS